MLIGGPIPPLRRDLEMTPMEHEGQPMLLLSDASGLEDRSYLVSPSVVLVASLFDGRRRSQDVSSELAQQKVTLPESQIQSMADQLDRFGLLETETVQVTRRKVLDDFKRSPVRKSRVKSRGLADTPLELGAFLGGFFTAPKGPGQPLSAMPLQSPPIGLIAPHIDFLRGGPMYAWGYGRLAQSSPPDVIVALGVAHNSPRSPWVMTRKSYETPFGPMEVEPALYDEIRQALWYDPLEEEWVHAKEHSLEFQALWLKHVWRDKTPKWVPLLCSAFDVFCQDRPPSSIQTIETAIKDVGQLLKRRADAGQKVLILAGVDLAHVGRRFGDEQEVTPDLAKKIEDADRSSLEKALKLDADAFFMEGVGQNAWRRVCGLSALYTAVRWVKEMSGERKIEGRLLAYDQAPDPVGGVVSFVSAVYDAGV